MALSCTALYGLVRPFYLIWRPMVLHGLLWTFVSSFLAVIDPNSFGVVYSSKIGQKMCYRHVETSNDTYTKVENIS